MLVAYEAALDGDSFRTGARDDFRPDCPKVVGGGRDAGFRRLRDGLQAVAGVGQHYDLVARDQEAARVAGHPVLAVFQAEPRQIAHVLGPDAEVGVDALTGETGPQSSQTGRAGRPIGLGPATQIGGGRGRGEVGWMRQMPDDRGHADNVTRASGDR